MDFDEAFRLDTTQRNSTRQRTYSRYHSPRYVRYDARVANVLGILQIVLGTSCAVLTIIGVVHTFRPVEQGVSSASFWIAAGSFGIASSYKRSSCFVITTMILSIISTITVIYYVALSFITIAIITSQREDNKQHYVDTSASSESVTWADIGVGGTLSSEDTDNDALLTISILMIAIGTLEGCVSVVASCLCCKVMCSCSKCCECGRRSHQNHCHDDELCAERHALGDNNDSAHRVLSDELCAEGQALGDKDDSAHRVPGGAGVQ